MLGAHANAFATPTSKLVALVISINGVIAAGIIPKDQIENGARSLAAHLSIPKMADGWTEELARVMPKIPASEAPDRVAAVIAITCGSQIRASAGHIIVSWPHFLAALPPVPAGQN